MQENNDKYTPEALHICDLSENISEAATKENLQTYQRKSNYGRTPVLIKLLTLLDYWSNQMEKLIAAIKIFIRTLLVHMKMQYMCKFMTTVS